MGGVVGDRGEIGRDGGGCGTVHSIRSTVWIRGALRRQLNTAEGGRTQLSARPLERYLEYKSPHSASSF